jgi:hypothetical protein
MAQVSASADELTSSAEPELIQELAAAPQKSLCQRTDSDIQQLAFDTSTRAAVVNQGGLLGDGVCWWHSRLQRSALYLATFRPDLPKATRAQSLAIINALANLSQVVVVPGYASFNEFSRDYEREIIARLESWQRADGFLHFRWIDSLKGHWRLPSRTLEGIMARIHTLVNDQHRILFEKLHFNSIASHAYLIIASRQTGEGYSIDVIDSNHPTETLTVNYRRGQTSLYKPDDNQPFVPYLDFEGDMGRIRGALQRFCK